jgi:hypothetical protein
MHTPWIGALAVLGALVLTWISGRFDCCDKHSAALSHPFR